ncbi:MAG TPA: ATP-grasp domain-containing protein [Ktedonobacteraceae bacterium]|nr:ATP-grasp domain-containing protein [Ktedonobacteraceae bacterium]
MRLTEAQGKQILRLAGVAVPQGRLAHSVSDAEQIAREYATGAVIKAQVLSPGRGLHGGIRFANNSTETVLLAKALLDTPIQGETVSSILIEERIAVVAEYYLAIRINPSKRCIDMIASRFGGNSIEEKAQTSPEHFIVASHRRNAPFFPYEARSLAARIGLQGQSLLTFADTVVRLYEAFCRFDARLLEINPLGLSPDGQLIALDAVMLLDDDAAFRLRQFEGIELSAGEEKTRPPTERELIAAAIDQDDYRGAVHYVDLDPQGEIGVISVGSGFSIALMDMLDTAGMTQANFCDCSGNPSAEKVKRATQLVLSIPSVRGFLFASGVVSQPLDVTARGIIEAFAQTPPSVPVVIRLAGDRDREGCELLRNAGVIHAYARERDMEDCLTELHALMSNASGMGERAE